MEKRHLVRDAKILTNTTVPAKNELSFAIVSCLAPNSAADTTLKGLTCAELVEVKPFWNGQCEEIASHLWLPTETDWLDWDMNLSTLSLRAVLDNSWFSARILGRPQKNLPKICSLRQSQCGAVSSAYSFTAGTDSEMIKSRLVKLYPTKIQREAYRYWLAVSRFVFNWTIDFIRSCVNWTPNWMEIKKYATQILPEWTKSCPFQIKGIAIKEATHAFFKAKGRPKFRSRKQPQQSCFIPASAIKESGIYPRVSGKGLRYSESLPESLMDSRLIWKAGKWFLALPRAEQRVPYGENQARVVAIDPGVRTFVTFYSDEICGHIGEADFSRIQRLAYHLDGLISRMSKVGKQQKRRMRLAAARIREKIKHLTDELHHKTALFLVRNFEHILLPTFETSQMVGKAGRKIRHKTVRSLLSFAHYRFKQFLKHKAFEYGKCVQEVCEAYTSQTHPETGELHTVGSAKRIRLQNGHWVNRDEVGARNILLRALVDKPDYFSVVAVSNF